MVIHVFEVASCLQEQDNFIWSIEGLKKEDQTFFGKIISNKDHRICAMPLYYDPAEEVIDLIVENLDDVDFESFSIFVESEYVQLLIDSLERSTPVLIGKVAVETHLDGPYMIQLATDSSSDHKKANERIRLDSFCPIDYLDPRVLRDIAGDEGSCLN
jgi:hypothetical protein